MACRLMRESETWLLGAELAYCMDGLQAGVPLLWR